MEDREFNATVAKSLYHILGAIYQNTVIKHDEYEQLRSDLEREIENYEGE